MDLRQTRSALSIIITAVIALSISAASASLVINLTFARYSFMADYFISDELAGECENQLDLQFGALSEKSGIPVRVFEAVKTENSVTDTILLYLQYFYNHNETEFNADTQTEYFYNLCTEYLDGNRISYNNDDVMNTAQEAAKIYADCCGLQNTQHFTGLIDDIRSDAPKAMLVGISVALICVLMLFILYSHKHYVFEYFASGIIGAGCAQVFTGIIGAIAGPGKSLLLEPQAYQTAFLSLVKTVFLILSLIGLVEILAGSIFYMVIYNKGKTKRKRS